MSHNLYKNVHSSNLAAIHCLTRQNLGQNANMSLVKIVDRFGGMHEVEWINISHIYVWLLPTLNISMQCKYTYKSRRNREEIPVFSDM